MIKHNKINDNYDREEREFKEQIPKLTEEWKKKGREILAEDKWDYWDEIVPTRLGDLYHGWGIGLLFGYC